MYTTEETEVAGREIDVYRNAAGDIIGATLYADDREIEYKRVHGDGVGNTLREVVDALADVNRGYVECRVGLDVAIGATRADAAQNFELEYGYSADDWMPGEIVDDRGEHYPICELSN